MLTPDSGAVGTHARKASNPVYSNAIGQVEEVRDLDRIAPRHAAILGLHDQDPVVVVVGILDGVVEVLERHVDSAARGREHVGELVRIARPGGRPAEVDGTQPRRTR